MNINWYPGHMKKTKDMLRDNIKLVDIVIEILDSRIPTSSKNPDIDQVIENKPKLILMNKSDLSNGRDNDLWKQYFEERKKEVLFVNSTNPKDIKKITKKIEYTLKDHFERKKEKGIKSKTVRAMIVGIPNVGKSTLINSLSGRKGAKTGNRPGVTMSKQWIKLKGNIELLDTPGILWPKFKDEETALNLAFTGAIKDEILDIETLALKFIGKVNKIDKLILEKRYGLTINEKTDLEVMDDIAVRRGAVLKNKEIDYSRVSNMILDEFRKGILGKITLEQPNRD